MKPTEFTVRRLRAATDTPPGIAFDCALWLANRVSAPSFVAEAERRIVEYLERKEQP